MISYVVKIISKLFRVANLYKDLFLFRFHFRRFFNNRSVAVVGGAPNTIGKKYGEEIDSHDIVVRMNLLTSFGKEDDLGVRTDFRFIGCTLLDIHNVYFGRLEKTSCLWTSKKNINFFCSQGRFGFFYSSELPRYVLKRLRKFLSMTDIFPNNKKPPRSGIVFLYLLLMYGKPSCVSVYGFSTNSDEAKSVVSYIDRSVSMYNSDDYEKNHIDVDFEIAALYKLIGLKKVNIHE